MGRLFLVAEYPAAVFFDDRARRLRRSAHAVPVLPGGPPALRGPREAIPPRRRRLLPGDDDHLQHLCQWGLRLEPGRPPAKRGVVSLLAIRLATGPGTVRLDAGL